MPKLTIWTRRFARFLVLPWLLVGFSFASSLYHYNIAVGADGKPTLQLTNDSPLPIFAFVMVEFPSLGMEGRTYYDFYVNEREVPIAPGASIIRGLSSFRGSEAKVRAEVRAVVFQDGTSDGDPVWVNAILAQRLRLYDRFRGVHELIEKQVGSGISRDGVLQMLRDAQADAEKQPADDDMRPIDSVVFHGAISTFDNNRQVPAEVVLERYLGYLRLRIAQMERSGPAMDTIRALPISTPKPSTDGTYSVDMRDRLAQLNGTPGSPSTCKADIPFTESPEPSITCTDSVGDRVTQNNTYTFSVKFSQYNGNTGKTTTVPWSSTGQFNAIGVCYQFNDCENQPDVYWKQGLAFGQGAATPGILKGYTATQGGNSVLFYWLLDRYQSPTFTECDECDLCPTCGYNPVSSDPQVPTTYWYFNYACTVT